MTGAPEKAAARRKSYKKIRFKKWLPDDEEQQQQQQQQPQQQPGGAATGTKPQGGRGKITVDSRYYRCPSPLARLPCNGIRQDPFIQLPVQAIGCVPATLDYFITVVSPQELSRTGNVAASALDHHLTLLLPFMLQSASLFQSIIALCRCSMLISRGHECPWRDDVPMLYHRHEALTLLRQSLESGPRCDSDANLLTVAMLLTLEYLSDNVAAVAAHLTGLRRLAAMRPDLDVDDDACDHDDDRITDPWRSFVKRGLKVYESLGSLVMGDMPTDSASDSRGLVTEAFAQLSLGAELVYPTLPFEPDLGAMLAKLPSGFSTVCLSAGLSVQTIEVLAALTAVCDGGDKSEGLCESRLAAEPNIMFYAFQRLSARCTVPTERYIILGLMAWTLQLCNLNALTMFHDPLLLTSIRLMSTHEAPESMAEQECFCWISMAVAGALALRSVRMPGAHVVLERLFAMYPLSRKWDTLEPVLQAFFWTPTVGAHWQKCWLDGMKRRAIVQARLREPSQPWEPLLYGQEHGNAGTASLTDPAAAQCPFLSKRAAVG